MIHHLFAAHRADGAFKIARIRLTEDLRQRTHSIFAEQYNTFVQNVEDEFEFDPGWKPDSKQLMTLPVNDEAEAILDAIGHNLTSIPTVRPSEFQHQNILALFTSTESSSDSPTILIQKFTARQALSRSLMFIGHGDTFTRLTDPVFTLAGSLVCVIEKGRFKFRSLQSLKGIFDLAHVVSEATEQQLKDFASHSSLDVWDPDAYVAEADDTSRRLIYQISQKDILAKLSADTIQKSASSIGFEIDICDGKIVVPRDRRKNKDLLRVLNDDRFRGLLSGELYVTNSKRRAT